MKKVFLTFFIILFNFFFIFSCFAKLEPGDLLYRTSNYGKIYGENSKILFKFVKDPETKKWRLVILNSGHVGIYVGRINKFKNNQPLVAEAVNRGVVLNPLKYFVNLDNGEKLIGIKRPNTNKDTRRLAATIAKIIASKEPGYDFSFRYQKGPKPKQWVCVGFTEKVYESANKNNFKKLEKIIEREKKRLLSIYNYKSFNYLNYLVYKPKNYGFNITPDGFDNESIFNNEGDCFSTKKEFSKINYRKRYLEFAGNLAGREFNNERYFFLPYTQFLQPSLIDITSTEKIASSFKKEGVKESKIRGRLPVLRIVYEWSKDYAFSSGRYIGRETYLAGKYISKQIHLAERYILRKGYSTGQYISKKITLTTSFIAKKTSNFLSSLYGSLSVFVSKKHLKANLNQNLRSEKNFPLKKEGEDNKTKYKEIFYNQKTLKKEPYPTSSHLSKPLPKVSIKNIISNKNTQPKKATKPTSTIIIKNTPLTTTTKNNYSKNRKNLLPTSISQSFCKIPKSFSPFYGPIIFNEIAWAGTKKSSSDEWIELKNISNKNISLEGYQIVGKSLADNKVKIRATLKGKILANNFYLLERSNDESVPYIKADLIYQGSLNNSNYQLFLFDNHCNILDAVIANQNWPAGSTTQKRTMERDSNLSWHNYYGSGTPLKKLLIYGTPKSPNSIKFVASPLPQSDNQNQQINWCFLPDKINLPTSQSVIFNEIAWMGNASNSYDEWIELKLASTSKIDLKNWQIIGRSNSQNNLKINLNNYILTTSSPYFVVEKNNIHPALIGIANQIYVGPSLPNKPNGYQLFLFDSDCHLVDYLKASSSWPGGSIAKKEYRSMEKDSLSWHTFSGAGKIINGYKIFATPGEKNSLATSTPAPLPTSTNPSSTKDIIGLKYLKISEIFLGSSSTNEQFIEFYNSSSGTIDLSNFSLQYLGGSKRSKTFHKIGSKTKPFGKISPYGFYLIASTSTIFGKKADFIFPSSFHLSKISTGGTIALMATTSLLSSTSSLTKSSILADKFAYGSGNVYPEEKSALIIQGSSFERKASSTSKEDNYYSWQFLGNGFDSNNNHLDFIRQNNPNPQNTKSLPEPRLAPKKPKNFLAMFENNYSKINFSWQFVSSTFYSLYYSCQQSSTKKIIAEKMPTSSYITSSKIIDNCNNKASFYLLACDKDGFCSKESTSSLVKPKPKNPYFENVEWYFENNKLKISFTASTSSKVNIIGIIDGEASNNSYSAYSKQDRLYSHFHLKKTSSTIGKTYYFNFQNMPLNIKKGRKYLLAINQSYIITGIDIYKHQDFAFERKTPPSSGFKVEDYLNFYIEDKLKNKSYLDNSKHYFGKQEIKIKSPYNYFNSSSSSLKIKIAYTNTKNNNYSKIYLNVYKKTIGENGGQIIWQNKIIQEEKPIIKSILGTSTFEISLPTSGLYIAFFSFNSPVLNENSRKWASLNISYSNGNFYFKKVRWEYQNNNLEISFIAKKEANLKIIPFINQAPIFSKDGRLENIILSEWQPVFSPSGTIEKFEATGHYLSTPFKNNIGSFQWFLCPITKNQSNQNQWQANGLNGGTIFKISPSSTYIFKFPNISWTTSNKIYIYQLAYPNVLTSEKINHFFVSIPSLNKNNFNQGDILFLYIEEYDNSFKLINRQLSNISYGFNQ